MVRGHVGIGEGTVVMVLEVRLSDIYEVSQ